MAILKHPDPITGEWIPLSSQGSVYVHTYTGTVHNFQGAGVLGIVYLTEDFTAGDTFTVNGTAVTLSNSRDLEITFKSGRWTIFLVVGLLLTFIQDYGVVRYDALMSLTEGEKVFVFSSIGAMPDGAVSTNLLINGGFDVWQRGTTQTTSAYASDDRWKNAHGVSAKTHTRQSFAAGKTDVMGNPAYYSRTVVTTGGTAASYVNKCQVIEDVARLSGKTVTVSFFAKADAGKNISIDYAQVFGSGGSATVSGIAVKKISITNSWALYTATAIMPSIAGKTIGSNSFTVITFWMDAGSNFNARTDSLGNQSGTFDLANVQLNYGTIALPFVPRSYADELRLCKRYCKDLTGYILRTVFCAADFVIFPMKQISEGMRLAVPSIVSTGWSLDTFGGSPQSGFSLGTRTSRDIVFNKTSHGVTDCIVYFNSGYADSEL